VARRRRSSVLPLGPDVESVGDANALDGPEPRGQQRERVHRAVVQGSDFEKGVGAVVPVGHAADVGVGVPQSHRAEPTVGEESTRAALGGRSRRPGRTAQSEVAFTGERHQRLRLVGVERERLLRVDVTVCLQRGPRHRRRGRRGSSGSPRAARVDRRKRRLQIRERRAVVIRGERCSAVRVEVDDAGQRQ